MENLTLVALWRRRGPQLVQFPQHLARNIPFDRALALVHLLKIENG
jgi:hypothetical protein